MYPELQKTLSQIVEKKFGIKIDSFRLENPPKKELGDIAFPCFQLAKDAKLAPPAIATQLKEFIEEMKISPSVEGDAGKAGGVDYSIIEKLEIAGPYLNITLNKGIYTKQFLDTFFSTVIPANAGIGQKIDSGTSFGRQEGQYGNAFSFPQRDELVIVDYIGANVGKPLHIGHMCTPNIGQTLVNLYKKLGYRVIGDSHIGDWGIIFGKLMYVWNIITNDDLEPLLTKYKSDEKLVKKAISLESLDEKKNFLLENEGVDFLLMLYAVFHFSLDNTEAITFEIVLKTSMEEREEGARKEFKLLSEGNPESIALWERITRQSIDFMQIQLDRLGVHPDYHVGESFYEGLAIPKMGNYPDLKYPMKDVVEELIQKGIAKRNDDGSAGVEFEKMPSTILQKRDGTHGYLASDLATIKYRTTNAQENITDANGKNWGNLKKIVYSVDVRQELHLQQVFDIARRAGWVDGVELFHASNGFISLKDGAMSTRTGKIIRLEALLDEAEERAKKIILEKRNDISGEELTKLAKMIGIGAIKYGYLSKSRNTNVVFDWDEFMTFEGNSGPYIQYAYVRGKSILEQLKIPHPNPLLKGEGNNLTGAQFDSSEEIELIKGLLNYKNILQETAEKNFPHMLAGYIYELTKQFNSFYNAVNIKNEANEGKKQLRLMLVSVFCETVKDGFNILGIEVPEKM